MDKTLEEDAMTGKDKTPVPKGQRPVMKTTNPPGTVKGGVRVLDMKRPKGGMVM